MSKYEQLIYILSVFLKDFSMYVSTQEEKGFGIQTIIKINDLLEKLKEDSEYLLYTDFTENMVIIKAINNLVMKSDMYEDFTLDDIEKWKEIRIKLLDEMEEDLTNG